MPAPRRILLVVCALIGLVRPAWADDAFGQPILLETLAHDVFFKYDNRAARLVSRNKTVQRIRVTIESAAGTVTTATPDRLPDDGQFAVSQIVFDRDAFSNTFEQAR